MLVPFLLRQMAPMDRHWIVFSCCLLLSSLLGAQETPETHNTEPPHVTVGAYVNDLQSLDLREHSYAMDVYVWFRWKGLDFDPSQSVEIANPNELWGHVNEPQYETPIELPSGELYQVLRIQGRFSHKFFFNNYPYDRQTLVVEFEDSIHEVNGLVYVADKEPVTLHPRLVLPGFRIGQPRMVIESFRYPTAFGDTRRSEPDSYSRVRIEIPTRRPLITSTLKMLLPVLCVVLGASLMLRLRVTLIDARLGIGITALLTVVAIQLSANDAMPNVDYLVLMDKIHLAAYAYVLVGLGIVLATVRQIDSDDLEAAQRLQRRGYWLTTTVFVLALGAIIAEAIVLG
jgi:hypothetical protein